MNRSLTPRPLVRLFVRGVLQVSPETTPGLVSATPDLLGLRWTKLGVHTGNDLTTAVRRREGALEGWEVFMDTGRRGVPTLPVT